MSDSPRKRCADALLVPQLGLVTCRVHNGCPLNDFPLSCGRHWTRAIAAENGAAAALLSGPCYGLLKAIDNGAAASSSKDLAGTATACRGGFFCRATTCLASLGDSSRHRIMMAVVCIAIHQRRTRRCAKLFHCHPVDHGKRIVPLSSRWRPARTRRILRQTKERTWWTPPSV